MAHSQVLRIDRELYDQDEAVDDYEEEPIEQDTLLEEGGDPSDVYHADDGPECDFSWQTPPENLADWLLASPPRARWRVIAGADGSLAVEYLGTGGWVRDPSQPAVVCRRHAVLTEAVRHQRTYLETGDVDTLRVLTPSELWTAVSGDDGPPEVPEEYQRKLVDVASDIRGQFFYNPSGVLHAVRFLFQDDVHGVALARVYQALAMITAEELRSRVCMKDAEVAEELNRRLRTEAFDAKRVARWREMKRQARERGSSTKRLYFPRRKKRIEGYGIV